ncbi:MAG: rRNA maturation RNase YbeY [Planctomycetota bacterium]
MTVEIHNLQTCIDIDLEFLEHAVHQVFDEVSGRELDLSISIVDDPTIQKINKEYLDHDYPTDVIAFNYGEVAADEDISGEVIISAETALHVAREGDYDAGIELVLYLVHGLLHLQGFDDKSENDATVMWDEQNRVMKKLGFTQHFLP